MNNKCCVQKCTICGSNAVLEGCISTHRVECHLTRPSDAIVMCIARTHKADHYQLGLRSAGVGCPELTLIKSLFGDFTSSVICRSITKVNQVIFKISCGCTWQCSGGDSGVVPWVGVGAGGGFLPWTTWRTDKQNRRVTSRVAPCSSKVRLKTNTGSVRGQAQRSETNSPSSWFKIQACTGPIHMEPAVVNGSVHTARNHNIKWITRKFAPVWIRPQEGGEFLFLMAKRVELRFSQVWSRWPESWIRPWTRSVRPTGKGCPAYAEICCSDNPAGNGKNACVGIDECE